MAHDLSKYPAHLHQKIQDYPELKCKYCGRPIHIQLRHLTTGNVIPISKRKHEAREYCSKRCQTAQHNSTRTPRPRRQNYFTTTTATVPNTDAIIPDGVRIGPMPVLPTAHPHAPASIKSRRLKMALVNALRAHEPDFLEAFVTNEELGTPDTLHLEVGL